MFLFQSKLGYLHSVDCQKKEIGALCITLAFWKADHLKISRGETHSCRQRFTRDTNHLQIPQTPLRSNIKYTTVHGYIYFAGYFFIHRYVPGQRASLNRLFHFLKTRLYSEPERHKPKVDRILFVIVESSSLTSKVLASHPVKSLEDKGVRVFILAVGKHVISSNQRTFRIGSFADVSKLSYAFRGTGELSIHVSNE